MNLAKVFMLICFHMSLKGNFLIFFLKIGWKVFFKSKMAAATISEKTNWQKSSVIPHFTCVLAQLRQCSCCFKEIRSNQPLRVFLKSKMAAGTIFEKPNWQKSSVILHFQCVLAQLRQCLCYFKEIRPN